MRYQRLKVYRVAELTWIWTHMCIRTHEEHDPVIQDTEVLDSAYFSLVFCCQHINMPVNWVQQSFCVEKVPLSSYARTILWSYLHLTCSCSNTLDSVIDSYFLHISFPGVWNRLALGSVTFFCPEQGWLLVWTVVMCKLPIHLPGAECKGTSVCGLGGYSSLNSLASLSPKDLQLPEMEMARQVKVFCLPCCHQA